MWKNIQQHFLKRHVAFGLDWRKQHDVRIKTAQDLARMRVESSDFSDLTDSTTGAFVQGSALQTLTVPLAFIHVSGSDLSPKAGFDTALGKIINVEASLADAINKVLAVISGRRAMKWVSGTVSTTLNALDLVLTGNDGSGGIGVDAVTGRDRLTKAAKNQNTIVNHLNRIATAIGSTPLTVFPFDGGIYEDGILQSPASTAAGVTGAAAATASLSDTAVDTFLTRLSSNYARICFYFNELIGAPVADLTDSSGGTASLTTLPAMTLPPAFTTSGSLGALKTDVDAALVVIENNLSDFTARVNLLARRLGLSEVTINTGASPDTTLASQSVAVTGADGSGSNVAPFAGTQAIFTTIRNAITTLGNKVNEVLAAFGYQDLVISTGGVNGSSIEDIPATGAGVGTGANLSVAKSDIDAQLVIIRNSISSMNGQIANITSATAKSRPVGVIVTP